MKQFLQLLCVGLAVGLAASCGSSTPTTQSKQATVTVQLDTNQYHVGQYVYIHGEIKGIIRKNEGCGCGSGSRQYKSGSGQYKVVVAGVDGSLHTWYVDANEISATRDTIVTRVIYSDSLISKINRISADQQTFSEDTRDYFNEIKNAITGSKKQGNEVSISKEKFDNMVKKLNDSTLNNILKQLNEQNEIFGDSNPVAVHYVQEAFYKNHKK